MSNNNNKQDLKSMIYQLEKKKKNCNVTNHINAMLAILRIKIDLLY